MDRDLRQREGEVSELLAKCSALEPYGDVRGAVDELSESLHGLQGALGDAHGTLSERRGALQVRAV